MGKRWLKWRSETEKEEVDAAWRERRSLLGVRMEQGLDARS